ncbi:MAG: phosphoribosylanthranilate isomerase [Peptococcaceae bacterium]|nr:phosphoribosylanthranilate isomerase [Peptococcaceae bacterium]
MNRGYIKVKICGIKDSEGANKAVIGGADALGFVFAPSKRKINPNAARDIILQLPPFISKVGVFVNSGFDEIITTIELTGIDTVQLHGEESPEFCKQLRERVKVIKSFPGDGNLNLVDKYTADAYLLDTMTKEIPGGSGKAFDWELAADFSKGPLILAGGLNPENIIDALTITRPYAVDVSSGVETEDEKDFNKISDFVRRVKIEFK